MKNILNAETLLELKLKNALLVLTLRSAQKRLNHVLLYELDDDVKLRGDIKKAIEFCEVNE